MQQDIRLGIADPQPADMQSIEKFRQDRTLEPDLEPIGVELQPEARLHQREDGGAGPGLRRAGYRIRRRRGVPAREAAEQFWQAARFPIGGGVEQAGKNPLCRVLEAIDARPSAIIALSCGQTDPLW